MLRLVCQVPNGKIGISRIAVLDVGDPKYDFGFATGHAVPTERPCIVRDFIGGKSSVNLIKIADGYESGEPTDWAIIRFDKMKTNGLVRYSLEATENVEALVGQEFTFARARGRPENSQKCKLSVLDFNADMRRVVHDCRAIPGQSGSPITRIVDGDAKLVGLHIGMLWMHESPATGAPDRKGYINLFNQKTVAAIEEVIAANRS
jgi:hypothetical protein